MANKGPTLSGDQILTGDDYLLSANSLYAAYMQDDGNFVLYYYNSSGTNFNTTFTNPYWATGTGGEAGGPFATYMQDDGNFVLYHYNSSTTTFTNPYWATGTGGVGQGYAIMQDDGNFVLYHGTPSNPGAAYWSNITVANGSITFDGSTALYPLANAVANSYEKTCTGATINVKQSESGVGLSEVAAGTVDIGNSDIFADPTRYPGLVDHQVAVVVFSVVINGMIGIKNLSSQQLIDIYGGKTTNWSSVGGPNLPIVTVSRPASSGTRATFDRFVLNGGIEQYGPRNLIAGQSSAVVQNVQSIDGTIGYVSTFYAQQNGLQTLTIDGVSDDLANVENNSYKFWNLEHMYTKGAATGLADAFIKYMASNSPAVVAARQAYGFIAPNGYADLVHVGLNPSTPQTTTGTASGVVNVRSDQNGSSVNVSVYGALPNQEYVVDIRGVVQIGTLTTNSQGTGTAHIDLTSAPTGTFYIDISVAPPGGGGTGGYGDTFIAGPFTLN